MNEFTAVLCHARRFKSAVKELTVEQLEEVKQKLDKIIIDRAKELEEQKKENAERLEKIKKIQEMLVADGIAVEELQAIPAKKTAKRAPREPKYEIKNDAGERVTWTGQGRMPNVFKAQVEKGKKMKEFLIKA
ncbi:H-NS histone family protein [Desulforhopalus sp. 52FAK]